MVNEVDGRLWIGRQKRSFLGRGRMRLLELIDEKGSISGAAREMKMSYKAAWDAIDSMNNLSEKPLVERVSGGRGGGGTVLTDYARELIETFRLLEEEHEMFLDSLSARINRRDGHLRMLERLSLRISARNQLPGEVVAIEKGAVNSLVRLSVRGGHTMTASVTDDSVRELDISVGSVVYALFKANALFLTSRDCSIHMAENRFEGVIERIEKGSVNHDITVLIEGGLRLTAQASGESILDESVFRVGMEVDAYCKASQIMIGIY